MQQERERNDIKIGKEEIKLSLFVDGMIMYAENPEGSSDILLSEFSKTAGYKFNM